jgi:hypothetical protein
MEIIHQFQKWADRLSYLPSTPSPPAFNVTDASHRFRNLSCLPFINTVNNKENALRNENPASTTFKF